MLDRRSPAPLEHNQFRVQTTTELPVFHESWCSASFKIFRDSSINLLLEAQYFLCFAFSTCRRRSISHRLGGSLPIRVPHREVNWAPSFLKRKAFEVSPAVSFPVIPQMASKLGWQVDVAIKRSSLTLRRMSGILTNPGKNGTSLQSTADISWLPWKWPFELLNSSSSWCHTIPVGIFRFFRRTEDNWTRRRPSSTWQS